jgi:hypothetical protein
MAKYFGEQDLDLLESALELIPDLTPTVLIAKFVREKIGYPVKSMEAFDPHFEKNGVILGDKTTFTHAQALKFLPKEFFPLETERDLLCRLLIAFQRGRLSHLLDKPEEVKREAGGELTILPSPSLTISDLIKLNQAI